MLKPYTLLENVLLEIENGVRDGISINTLADQFSLSSVHLSRIFKDIFNHPLGGYIRSRKLASSLDELIKTNANIIDIALDYDFMYEQTYIRSFKREFGITPGEFRKNMEMIKVKPPYHIINSNRIVNLDGYRYEAYKDNDAGDNAMALTEGACFKCKWNKTGDAIFRSGKSFDETKTHAQFGSIKMDYSIGFNSETVPFLGVYGWFADPLVEFFIIENWSSCDLEDKIYKATVNIDGDRYLIFEQTRVNWPSIKGIQTFKEYYSVRSDKRNKGIIYMSKHFDALERIGMKLGKIIEISIAIEGWHSSGEGDVYRNLLTIGDNTMGSTCLR